MWAMGTTMKGAQQFVQPQNITSSVLCQRSVASRHWEAPGPRAGQVPSKEGCGEQLVGACSPLLGMEVRDGLEDVLECLKQPVASQRAVPSRMEPPFCGVKLLPGVGWEKERLRSQEGGTALAGHPEEWGLSVLGGVQSLLHSRLTGEA